MDRYAIYLRKSRADLDAERQGELETLSRHEKTLIELAIKMKTQVCQIYREIVSGEKIASRPVMKQLLQEVEQGMWTGILVMEVERLARGDARDQQIVLNAFKEGSTKIITPMKIYDPNDEFDEEYFEFGLFMSRREYNTINRRIQGGRIASVKEGKTIVSRSAFGYNKIKIPNDKGYTLTPNEDAKVVKLIFDLYVQGKGMPTIAKELDSLNIKPRYRDSWSKSTIRDILSNPVYIGKIRWAYKKDKKTITNGEAIITRVTNEDYYLIDGIHPAIIERDVFYRAKDLRARNATNITKEDLSLKNPLSGLIFCRECNSLMNRLNPSSRVLYDVIKCPNKECGNVSAPISRVEKRLITMLSTWLLEYQMIILERAECIDKDYLEKQRRNIRMLKDQLILLKKQVFNSHDLLERGIDSVETFVLRNKLLVDKMKSSEKAFIGAEDQLKITLKILQIRDKYIPEKRQLLLDYDETVIAQKKNEILKLLLNRVEYSKPNRNKKGQKDNDNYELVIYPMLPDIEISKTYPEPIPNFM